MSPSLQEQNGAEHKYTRNARGRHSRGDPQTNRAAGGWRKTGEFMYDVSHVPIVWHVTGISTIRTTEYSSSESLLKGLFYPFTRPAGGVEQPPRREGLRVCPQRDAEFGEVGEADADAGLTDAGQP